MPESISFARKFWVKLTNWEFWPFSILYFPVYFYYTWLVIKCRSFFFFTAANPTIDFGGMLGESKSEVLGLIPDKYKPKSVLLQPGECEKALSFANKVSFPVIAKPDVGERGNFVEKMETSEKLLEYVNKLSVPFLLQEFVDLPIELGLFYVRFPGEERGKITSIVQKDFLHVIGDGKHTVGELLANIPRAVLQLEVEHPRFFSIINQRPAEGEKIVVEEIGNHCRGTTFLDRSGYATEALNRAFDNLANQIDGFYFGRYDLRCNSWEELGELKNFKILELNGAGAEPAHIYQPGFSLWKAYKVIFWHLNVLAQLSQSNRKRGHTYWSFGRGIRKIRAIRKYNRTINNNQ